jgi:hypothetical protein
MTATAPITTANTRSTITSETLAHPRRKVPNYFPRFAGRTFTRPPFAFREHSMSYRNPSPILHSVHTGRAAIVDALDRPLRPQTVVLAFNEIGAADVCLVIDRTPRDLSELTVTLIGALTRMSSAATVIIGTTCVGSTARTPLVASADEHIAFLEAREVFELEGIDLVDWFLVGDAQTLSLATLTDAQPRWLLGARSG